MPAKAGIQNYFETLDSCLRANDVTGCFKTFYKTINFTVESVYHMKSNINVVNSPFSGDVPLSDIQNWADIRLIYDYSSV